MNRMVELESQINSDPFNPLPYIALAKAYLEEGDEERARKIIAVKRKLPSKDPSVHYEWGKLCEEIGMARQAIESYEQAIALNPNHTEYHFRIALLYYEKKAWERAIKHLQKTISLSPQNDEARRMLASLYEGMGLKGLSEIVKKEKPKQILPSQTLSFGLTEEDVFTLKSLFQGKEFGYAYYQIGAKGEFQPVYVNRTLVKEEFYRHINGEVILGIYPLRSDRTAKFSVIRIRIPHRKLLANAKNEGFLALTEDHIHHYAKSIFNTMRDCGMPVYLENFGGRERRLWIFFAEFMPVELISRFSHHILDQVPTPSVDLSVEVLLGVKGAGVGWMDDPIPLPLGINPLTGKRCFFIDGEGEPYEDQLLFLKKVRPIDSNQMQRFLRLGRATRPLISNSMALMKHLEAKCSVLADIFRKARSGRKLQSQEKLVIYFSIGFLNDGERLLHEIFEPCPDYRPQKVNRMMKRLRGKPISCPKIRQLMPERTAYLPCNCSFEISEGGYPSPVLHIR